MTQNEETYHAIERAVGVIGGRDIDVQRAEAHLVMVRFIASRPTQEWSTVMDLSPLNEHAWAEFPVHLAPVPVLVKRSLAAHGFDAEIVISEPSLMRARRLA